MKRRHWCGWRRGCVLLAAVCGLTAQAGQRSFDPFQSSAGFSVRVLWLHAVRGSIGDVDGVLTIDAAHRARVEASIEVALIKMDDPRYLSTIRSADFFDSARYPQMHFRSALFDPALLATGGALDGWLSLRGVTRPVRFELLPGNCTAPAAGPCAIRVRGSVRRSDFGMNSHRFSVADQVQLRLAITLAPVGSP
ncbi:MAG TPA: YceI family protein [Rhodanobacteraceae bacterium]|nr:YceI family protein [Rhodanobacteraceae bacterium]